MIRLGPYELVREIAVGGMAEVHLARISGIGGFEKYVALKTIHPQYAEEPMFVEMLVNEAKLAVQLIHPNIAQTFDLGLVGDTYYMSMEYVDGIDVWQLLTAAGMLEKRLPLDACAFIMRDVAAALDHAHACTDAEGNLLRVVHRDVSPQNVMITWDGMVKLVDFGIAKAAGSLRHTQAGAITGKYRYLSPEQAWTQELDGRSDIFATGLLLHEMLTGRPVYADPDLEKVIYLAREAVITPPSVWRPDVPAQLDRIVMRALARDRNKRYQQAGEMSHDLQDFLRVHAPRFVAASLASLIATLVAPPTMTREPSLSDLDDLIRRFTNDELAHAGDEMLDANSIISHSILDLGGSSIIGDTITTDTVVDGRLPDEPPTPRPPTQLGLGSRPQTPAMPGFERFAVHEQLGWSVLATVHRATLATKTTARDVALKRLAPQLADDPAFGERFLEQLERVSSIEHLNLAKIVDYGRIERVHYVAAELMTGSSLRKLLARGQPAPIAIVVGVATQLLDGLVAAHRSTVLHGSVTSGNVFVQPDGIVKLTDLGVAHVLWGAAPHAIAKLGYMAPEVAMGGVLEPRADVFAVGVIAWELAAGRRLFDGRSPREILQQVRSLRVEPPSRYNARCDAQLDGIILSALLPYDRRARTAEAMRAALQPFTNHLEDHRDAIAAWVQRGDDEQAEGLELDVHRFTLDQPLTTEPMPSDAALTASRPQTAPDASLEESKVIIIERGDDDEQASRS